MVRSLTVAEVNSDKHKKLREQFDEKIKAKLGTAYEPPSNLESDSPDEDEFVLYEDDEEIAREMPDFTDPVDSEGRPIDQQPMYDRLINLELYLPQGSSMRKARVLGRTVGPDDRTLGTWDDNHFLNTLVYDVEFLDGEVKEYSANVIGKNLLDQVDLEGYSVYSFDCIVDYRKEDDAVSMKDQYVEMPSG